MATKAELAKAFDGGQAAQAGGFPAEGCPFDEENQTDEYNEWMKGYDGDLADKWLNPARALTKEIEN